MSRLPDSPLISLEYKLTELPSIKPEESKSVVIVGTAWGDEGKGKEVDRYVDLADLIVRYNGGGNAGHTLVINGDKYILHVIPSGIMNLEADILLGDGVVVSPNEIITELDELHGKTVTVDGVTKPLDLENRLYVSENTDIITPLHLEEDVSHEVSGNGVGSTRNGIRPAYEDRAGRRAVTYGDIIHRPEVAQEMLEKQVRHWRYGKKSRVGDKRVTREARKIFKDLEKQVNELLRRGIQFVDGSKKIDLARDDNKNIIYEGAQGTFLDVKHGTYRYVTSSHPIAGGACTGAGVGPGTLDDIVGIVKLTMTRVGDGPFPSELVNENLQKKELMDYLCENEGISIEDFNQLETADQRRIRKHWASEYSLSSDYQFIVDNMIEVATNLEYDGVTGRILSILHETQDRLSSANNEQEFFLQDAYNHILGMATMVKAQEYGATTGRPRRTGWLDIASLRHAVRVNGLTGLALTKLDCLGDFEEVKILTHYTVDGEVHKEIPLYQLDKAVAHYETLAGWDSKEVEKARTFEELPENARKYVTRIAELTGVRIYSIGVGPGREQTIELHNPFTGEGIYMEVA